MQLTVAVAVNLPDGVILGVDSAVTVGNPTGVLKVFENAQKMFQLAEKRIGIAAFGLATIGNRTIGSYIREFELLNPRNVVTQTATVKDVVEELRAFFLQKYLSIVIPAIQTQTGQRFEDLPDDQKPILGLAVGGFSDGQYLSEVWEILIPIHGTANSAKLWRGQGDFGGTWFALNEPIFRYVKGYDRGLLNEVKGYFSQLRGTVFTVQEEAAISNILQKYEYQIPFPAMPLQEGVAHAKFLVEMVINHHRFALGAPVVGGKASIGLVTYKGEKFQII